MSAATRRPRTADGSPQGQLRNVPPPYERWPRASGGPERAGKGAETTQPAPRMNRAGEDVGAGSGETATPHRSKSKQARLRQVGRLVQCRQNRRGRTAVTWPCTQVGRVSLHRKRPAYAPRVEAFRIDILAPVPPCRDLSLTGSGPFPCAGGWLPPGVRPKGNRFAGWGSILARNLPREEDQKGSRQRKWLPERSRLKPTNVCRQFGPGGTSGPSLSGAKIARRSPQPEAIGRHG